MVGEGRDAFSSRGYEQLDGLIDPRHADHLARYLILQLENGRLTADASVADAAATYGDPVFDVLLDLLAPTIAEVSGAELLPTYSYARLYTAGNELERHRDRRACEVSVTLTLGGDTPDWPLWIDHPSHGPVAFALAPGSALLYQGGVQEHWREPCPGTWHAQLFLHWVRAVGAFADEIFDRRAGLGLPAVNRS